MTLANGWILHGLWLLPLTAFALIYRYRRRQKTLDRFAEPALLKRLTLDSHAGKRFVKGLLLIAALGLSIFALAGPRWGNRYQEVSRKGVDIMVLMDVSRSMAVEDVQPNRLERAKREVIDLIQVVQGDRLGLTAFSGAAFVQCPLTLDYAAVEMFLKALDTGIIPVPGTDLGAAIKTGLSGFDFESASDKVMLLITDGEDNEQRGLEAARSAAGQDVKIFVFGMGEPAGGPIPAADGQGGFVKDDDGQLVLSKLDEKTLQDIATVTGGGYVRSVAGDLDLDLLYFDGIKKKTEAQLLKSGKIKVYEERFNLFVLAAFMLLLLEGVLDDKRRPTRGIRVIGFIAYIFILVLGMGAAPAQATDSADNLYRQGRFSEAAEAYARKDMDHPGDIRYRYNRGCAAFQNGQYAEAAAAFTSTLRRAEDPQMRFKAVFNLGNTAFKQGDFTSAAGYYKQALTELPDNMDAKHNLELALRALEEAKQQQTPESPKGEGQTQPDAQDERQPERNSGKDAPPPSEIQPEANGEKNAGKKRNTERDSNEPISQDDRPSGNSLPPEDSGNLKPQSNTSEGRGGMRNHAAASSEDDAAKNSEAIDRDRAEALLDNIYENPAGILRFMVPDKHRRGNLSGRNW